MTRMNLDFSVDAETVTSVKVFAAERPADSRAMLQFGQVGASVVVIFDAPERLADVIDVLRQGHAEWVEAIAAGFAGDSTESEETAGQPANC